jgi:hypothetical protein
MANAEPEPQRVWAIAPFQGRQGAEPPDASRDGPAVLPAAATAFFIRQRSPPHAYHDTGNRAQAHAHGADAVAPDDSREAVLLSQRLLATSGKIPEKLATIAADGERFALICILS